MTYPWYMDSSDDTLGDLVLRRVQEVTAGNKAAYGRRFGISPQMVDNLVSGTVKLPKRPLRDELAADLGISVLEIFRMAGDIEYSDIPGRDPEKPVTPDKARSLCNQLRRIDWDRVADEGQRYAHLVEDLETLAERYPAQQET